MKGTLAIVAAIALNCLVVYIMFSPWHARNSSSALMVFMLFAIPAIGGYWMIYVSILHEKRPLSFVLLALVPYAFLWYYVERVRTGKCKSRDVATQG